MLSARLRFLALRCNALHSFSCKAVLLLSLVGLGFTGITADAQTPISGQPVPSLSTLDTIMQTYMAQYSSPGASLSVTVDGRLVFARGYGYAKVDTGEFVQPDSLFRIASNSKPITAAGIYKLIEQGKLSLTTQPFATTLSDLTPPAGTTEDPRYNSITIQQLLQHTAGFDDTTLPDPAQAYAVTAATTFNATPPATPQLLIKYMLGQPLQHDPGTTYAYSNLGYIILGYVIERVSGTPYATYIQNNVFATAGIVRTVPGASLLANRQPNEVAYYDYPGAPLAPSDFPPVNTPVPYPYGGYSCELQLANGCWISSPMDLLRFADSINGQFSTNIFATPPPSNPFRSPAFYFAIPPTGPGWEYVFYGSLPGTNSLVHLITNTSVTGKVSYSAIFNTRSGTNIEQPEGDADNAIAAYVKTVTAWPTGNLFTIYQGTGSSCSFTLSATSQTATLNGGASTVTVTDANYCAWSAVTSATWLHLTSGTLNSNTGTVGYTVDANTGAPRTGTITIAGQTFTVTQNGVTTPTTLVLTTNKSTVNVGQPVTLTATISPFTSGSNTTNGETVTFSSGATALGSGTLAGGVATLTTSSLLVGTDGVTASYAGDTYFASSGSSSVQVVVSKTTTALALAAAPSAAIVGQPVVLTATLTPSNSGSNTTNGETVTFSNGATALGSGTLAAGVATLTTSSLPAATNGITVSYAGDTYFASSVSSSVQVVVTIPVKTTTALTLAATPTAAIVGQAVVLTATLTPSNSGGNTTSGETVTFSNAGTALGTGTLAGGVATLTTSSLPAGTNAITASYAGDTYFTSAASSSVQVVITTPAKTTTALALAAVPSTATYGQSVVLTATLTPSSAGSNTTNGETITFSNAGSSLGTASLASGIATFTTTALPTGTDSLTAVYAGDTYFTGSNAALNLTIGKGAATVALGSLAATYNASAHPATATTTPVGLNVGFTYNGSATAPTAAGSYPVVATVTDPNYTGTATGTLVIAKAAATLTLGGLSASVDGTPHAATATTVPAGLSVTFTYNGSATAPSAAGSYAVIGTIVDPNYTGTATGTLVIVTPLIASTTTLSSSAASVNAGTSVTFTATVKGTGGTPTGTVTFSNGGATLGTGILNSGGVATLTTNLSTAGVASITAQYGGDTIFSASTSAVLSQTVVAVGISASVSPSTLTIASGSSGTMTITLTPTGGYTGTVSFSCAMLPDHANCAFAPASIAIAATTTTATDVLTISTKDAASAMLSAPHLSGRPTEVFSALALLLPGSLVGLFGLSRRKRLPGLSRFMLVALFCLGTLGIGALTGCAGPSGSSTTTPAGTYTVQVTLSPVGSTTQIVNATVIVQ